MSKLTKIKQAIARLGSLGELGQVASYCRQRQKVLQNRAWEARKAEAVKRAREFKQGQRVWCCAVGTFIGGAPMQRGDSAIVYQWQPRKKVLWLRLENPPKRWDPNRVIGFDAHSLQRYNIRAEPPDGEPLSKWERNLADTVGGLV